MEPPIRRRVRDLGGLVVPRSLTRWWPGGTGWGCKGGAAARAVSKVSLCGKQEDLGGGHRRAGRPRRAVHDVLGRRHSRHRLLGQRAALRLTPARDGAPYLSRSITRRTCPGSQIPRPVAVGTPRLLSSFAIPYHDVIQRRQSVAVRPDPVSVEQPPPPTATGQRPEGITITLVGARCALVVPAEAIVMRLVEQEVP